LYDQLKQLSHVLLVPDSSQVPTAQAWAFQMRKHASSTLCNEPGQLSLQADPLPAVVVADVTSFARWLQRVTGDMASSRKPAKDGPLWHLEQMLLWQAPQCEALDWPSLTADVLRLVEDLADQQLLQRRPTIMLGAQVRGSWS
jgi:hypothetical protein